ncbi:LSU ribosomal protein L23P [Roseivirga ehrenbergii]|uniref:Large ribosomal subunit protein uL23 n=3 Tax=Roseivirga TaxID=290180 RepID=A0A0L8AN08_9BACT|nr:MULTISPECIES: 50S ribosomal protein L23 [Roseivirga]KOF03565.1 50S ribosomal protein L23 [Roseivirga seohaensis subsp. aquiponti]KYG80680.1 50S ribosomal protein L23 [Roseivirga ehrenbergii]KYG85095.1 50S ribosomal protein L23 [Roseivirga seohaensis]TCL07931.1 LSU ribosomal protein L23P [Roseivirga ehrenbergii]
MSVLKKPLVTEKVSALNEKGKYGFVVDYKANKIEIKVAVEQMYGVTVEDVNTMRYSGKTKSRMTKSRVVQGQTSAFKKAIVTVAEGDVIDFYSGI